MKFGIFFTLDYPAKLADISPEQYFQQITEQVKFAESLHFHSVWFTEQHFESEAGLCPYPPVLMSYIAANTSTIRLGSGVTLPALYNPIHLAESYALLDVLTGGRVDIGLGTSSIKNVYDLFGVTFSDRYLIRDKSADLLCSFWGCQRPSLANPDQECLPSNIKLGLYPLQKPHPPIWISTGTADRVKGILKGGHSVLFDYLFCDFQKTNLEIFKSGVSTPDIPPRKIGGVVYAQLQGIETSYLYFRNFFEDFLKAQRGSMFELEPLWNNLQENGLILCCAPDEAKRRVNQIAQSGLDLLLLGVGYGGMPHATTMSTIELFAKEIMVDYLSVS